MSGDGVIQRSADGSIAVHTKWVLHTGTRGYFMVLCQRLFDSRDASHGLKPYADSTVTLEKHELEAMRVAIDKVLNSRW